MATLTREEKKTRRTVTRRERTVSPVGGKRLIEQHRRAGQAQAARARRVARGT